MHARWVPGLKKYNAEASDANGINEEGRRSPDHPAAEDSRGVLRQPPPPVLSVVQRRAPQPQEEDTFPLPCSFSARPPGALPRPGEAPTRPSGADPIACSEGCSGAPSAPMSQSEGFHPFALQTLCSASRCSSCLEHRPGAPSAPSSLSERTLSSSCWNSSWVLRSSSWVLRSSSSASSTTLFSISSCHSFSRFALSSSSFLALAAS
mmetsp:Transcript_20824/g.58163  ORF Transcript_20824/g.58163 Transcript_20824/m.58163 type:complete len:207 (+) Transcript_20824:63-683(+)